VLVCIFAHLCVTGGGSGSPGGDAAGVARQREHRGVCVRTHVLCSSAFDQLKALTSIFPLVQVLKDAVRVWVCRLVSAASAHTYTQ
jgi:hypothetical protein